MGGVIFGGFTVGILTIGGVGFFKGIGVDAGVGVWVGFGVRVEVEVRVAGVCVGAGVVLVSIVGTGIGGVGGF